MHEGFLVIGSSKLKDRLTDRIRTRNRELAGDAALKGLLGVVFSLLTFGVVFWFAWVFGFCFVTSSGIHPALFAAIISGVFFVAATVAAWQRVDPLVELAPPGDENELMRHLAHAAGQVYFNPRYAIAGAALVLIGGPAGILEAIGIWLHRLPTDPALIEQGVLILEACDPKLPSRDLRSLPAAFLLWRLGLVKIVPHEEIRALTLTDTGFALLGKGTPQAAKRSKPD